MIKLHLGCGNIKKEGYTNIDAQETKAADLVADCGNLPFEPNTVDVIESYHLLEHLPKYVAIEALFHWLDILKPSGKLIMEMPNFEETTKDYVAGNKERIKNIYGLQRNEYDFHYYGYSPKTLAQQLKEIGYKNIKTMEATDYHTGLEPCFRIEAEK